MLLGYNPKNNSIEFLFSDTNYLNRMYPGNKAHITNFWKIPNHGLVEMFIDEREFPDYRNYKLYKVKDGKIVRKNSEEIALIMNPHRNSIARNIPIINAIREQNKKSSQITI